MVDVVAVDWSGAKTGAARHIWLAHVRDGRLDSLEDGRSREQLVEHVIDLKSRCPDGLVVGLDFSFSFPAWVLETKGFTSVVELWQEVAAHGEQWLDTCPAPFWGRPGRPKPVVPAHLRLAEARARIGGIAAKSTFQIGGAGAVGTGSIRGMPFLLQLQRAGFGIWPFDPVAPWTVIEMYPRLLTGPVNKADPRARAEYVRRPEWGLAHEQQWIAASSEDAFDAAISALVMSRHFDRLSGLEQSSDPVTLLEGSIWDPNNIDS